MDKAEAQRQLDFLNSEAVREWRQKFPEKYESDVARLEKLGAKREKNMTTKLLVNPSELERSKRMRLKTARSVTLDGERITLEANIELPPDAERAKEMGADGIGLFRTEFLFMNRDELPTEDEQFEAYRQVVKSFPGKPVTILIPPDRQNEEPAILDRIRHGELVDHYETVRRRRDGSLDVR